MTEIKHFINENGRILTGFVAALILFGGMAVYNRPENWWIIPLGISVIAVITLLFINAKPFIKSVLTLMITLFFSAEAYQVGFNLHNEDVGAIWMWLTILNLFVFLSISYAKESNVSRWNIIILSQVLSFVYFFTLIISLDFRVSLIIGEVLSLLTFAVFYYIPFKNFSNTKQMPKVILNKDALHNIRKQVDKADWNYKILEKQQTVIIWGEMEEKTYSAVIIPIKMDQKFGVVGKKKKQQLSYKGRPINSWLTSLLTHMIPYWKLRNLSPLPILYDIEGYNGYETKIIGVHIADRKQPIPFIITPLKHLNKVLSEFQDLMLPTTAKQIKALEELGE